MSSCLTKKLFPIISEVFLLPLTDWVIYDENQNKNEDKIKVLVQDTPTTKNSVFSAVMYKKVNSNRIVTSIIQINVVCIYIIHFILLNSYI